MAYLPTRRSDDQTSTTTIQTVSRVILGYIVSTVGFVIIPEWMVSMTIVEIVSA